LAAREEQEIGAKLEQETKNLAKPSSENEEEDEEEEEDDDEEEDDEEEVTGTSNEDEDSSSDCSSSVGPDWKLRWLQREFYTGRVPRQVIASIMPHFATGLAADTDDSVLWDYLAHLLNEPKRRNKLASVNTFDDVISLVKKSQKIIVLTGAGVSVSCGIPDFRSTNGIYARLAHDFPDLPDPQAMFDINYFKRDPRPFYKFAREIYPGEFQPSPCHRFIKMLETKGKLLRNYTQNIDTLERVAGIQRVIECHGSFSTASCTKCRFKCNADALRADIFAQRIPVCPQCQPNKEQSVDASVAVTEEELRQLVENGIMKPDIVFFGEGRCRLHIVFLYFTSNLTNKSKIFQGNNQSVYFRTNHILLCILNKIKYLKYNKCQFSNWYILCLLFLLPTGLPDEYHTVMATDKDVCDLLIVIGSSLKVRPVAHIPSSIPATVPQILINREQLHHLKFDVELLGDSDVIINQICHRLSDNDECWRQLCCDESVLSESKELMPPEHYHHNHHHHASHHLHHHRHCSSESEQQSQLDTDTQSLKSNSSADYILGSAGTCSDSGFESSTFTSGKRSTAADAAAIERIKTDILVELNETTALSCDRLAVGAPSTTVESYRHLSIDSSKDSGIEQCDNEASPSYVRPSNLVQETKTVAPSLTPIPQQRGKRQTAAERLQPGTFYSHTNNYSYVFPGAQVFWDNDYSDDDDEEEERGHNKHGDLFGNVADNYNDEDEDACDLNAVPLSPLLPPSLEAHIVTEIVNGVDEPVSNSSPGQKRPACILEQPPTAIPTPAIERETPPLKKRRPSEEDGQQSQIESSEESPPPGQLAAV